MSFSYRESYQAFCKIYFSWNTEVKGECLLTHSGKEEFAFELFLVLKGIKQYCYFKMGDGVNNKTHKDIIQLIKGLNHPNLKIVEVFSMKDSSYKTAFFNGKYTFTEEDLKKAYTDLEQGINSINSLSTDQIENYAREIGKNSY